MVFTCPLLLVAVVSYNQEEPKAMQCFNKKPDIIKFVQGALIFQFLVAPLFNVLVAAICILCETRPKKVFISLVVKQKVNK